MQRVIRHLHRDTCRAPRWLHSWLTPSTPGTPAGQAAVSHANIQLVGIRIRTRVGEFADSVVDATVYEEPLSQRPFDTRLHAKIVSVCALADVSHGAGCKGDQTRATSEAGGQLTIGKQPKLVPDNDKSRTVRAEPSAKINIPGCLLRSLAKTQAIGWVSVGIVDNICAVNKSVFIALHTGAQGKGPGF